MPSVRRRSVPAAIAILVAFALVPLAPRGVAAADAYYAATCTARLRATPSTNAASIISMPTGTVVTLGEGAVAGKLDLTGFN